MPGNLSHLSGRPWTIAYGNTGTDVVPGLEIDKAEAERRFAARLEREFEPAVRRAVQAPLMQRQFDALVSIFYNCGVVAMTASTLVRRVNEGDHAGATGEFAKWNRSCGVVLKGLQRRREAERRVY